MKKNIRIIKNFKGYSHVGKLYQENNLYYVEFRFKYLDLKSKKGFQTLKSAKRCFEKIVSDLLCSGIDRNEDSRYLRNLSGQLFIVAEDEIFDNGFKFSKNTKNLLNIPFEEAFVEDYLEM